MWHGDPSWWGWWGWTVMMVGMVAFWALVVWAIVVLARRDDQRDATPAPQPEEILRLRLARGEIDEETYRQTIDVLRARQEEWATPAGQQAGVTGHD